jgi:hypothetical protein
MVKGDCTTFIKSGFITAEAALARPCFASVEDPMAEFDRF